MLDIQIFSVDKPLYHDGKKVGTMPHISLGTYTQPTQADKEIINSFYNELSPAHRSIFNIMIRSLGQSFFASSLVNAIEESHNPFARQQMLHFLREVHPTPFQSQETLLAQQQQILNTMHKGFRPTHMVAMMMDMKSMHDEAVRAGEVNAIQDEIFARGIAKCVQSIQDLPEKEKTPQIQRLCKRGTHRWREFNYSRS